MVLNIRSTPWRVSWQKSSAPRAVSGFQGLRKGRRVLVGIAYRMVSGPGSLRIFSSFRKLPILPGFRSMPSLNRGVRKGSKLLSVGCLSGFIGFFGSCKHFSIAGRETVPKTGLTMMLTRHPNCSEHSVDAGVCAPVH